MAGKNRLQQQPQSNQETSMSPMTSLMKRPVTGILDPGLSTAGLERHNCKGIAEA